MFKKIRSKIFPNSARPGNVAPKITVECSICCEPQFAGSQAQRNGEGQKEFPSGWVVTQCGHFFHETCLVNWFKLNGQRICQKCSSFVPPRSGMIRLGDEGHKGMQRGGGNEGMGEAPPVPFVDERPCCGFLVKRHDSLIKEIFDLHQDVRNLKESVREKDFIIETLNKERVGQFIKIDYQQRQIEEANKGRSDSPK